MPPPLTSEQLETIIHRELTPLRTEIGDLRRSLDGESGLRVTVARLDERVESLRKAVEGDDKEPPDRSMPSSGTDPGSLSVRLPAPVVRWLLGALTIGGLGAGVGWQGRALVVPVEEAQAHAPEPEP